MSKVIEVYSKGERYEVVIDDDIILPGKISKINNYFCINVNRKQVRLHRWIMGLTDSKLVVDHIDNDPKNNKRENLRVCTQRQNTHNRKHKGYKKCKTTGRYVSYIRVNDVNINLGTYNTKEDARLAYKIEHVKSFGEYSPYYKEKLLNNPPKKSQMVKAGKGYTFKKTSNKYEAKINIRGKRIQLGSFSTPEEAQQVYRKAHAEAFGEFSPYYKYDQGNTKEVN